MPAAPAITKPRLREVAHERLRLINESQRESASASACARLMETPGYTAARAIMLYAPTREEIDIAAIAEAAFIARKRVCFPRMDWGARTMRPMAVTSLADVKEVRRNGIPEPMEGEYLPLDQIDLAVVPGLAFDLKGYRLGRGAGFYDRFLQQYRSEGPKRGAVFGIAFEIQIFSRVPVEEHDQPLDGVVTEGRLVICRRQPR